MLYWYKRLPLLGNQILRLASLVNNWSIASVVNLLLLWPLPRLLLLLRDITIPLIERVRWLIPVSCSCRVTVPTLPRVFPHLFEKRQIPLLISSFPRWLAFCGWLKLLWLAKAYFPSIDSWLTISYHLPLDHSMAVALIPRPLLNAVPRTQLFHLFVSTLSIRVGGSTCHPHLLRDRVGQLQVTSSLPSHRSWSFSTTPPPFHSPAGVECLFHRISLLQ